MWVAYGSREKIKKFIDEVDLFTIKPDSRAFGCNSVEDTHSQTWVDDFDLWVSIPDDLAIPTYVKKREFYGGLYASVSVYPGEYESERIFTEWLDNNDDYENNNGWHGINRPQCSEYFNVFNRHGLNDQFSKQNGFTYFDVLTPIKQIDKPTAEQSAKMNAELALLEKSALNNKSVKINLKTMVRLDETDTYLETRFENNMLVLYNPKDHECEFMATLEKFSCPAKISMRAKTDSSSIALSIGGYTIIIKWTRKEMLICCDPNIWKPHEWKRHRKIGDVPLNEFVDIEWFIGINVMAIIINGELRYIGTEHKYIEKFIENPKYKMTGNVLVGTENEATVTVESLQVTEL
jgi:hypothetical protein